MAEGIKETFSWVYITLVRRVPFTEKGKSNRSKLSFWEGAVVSGHE